MIIKRFLCLLSLVLCSVAIARLNVNQFNGFNAAQRDPVLLGWFRYLKINGGTYDTTSVTVATNLSRQMHKRSYFTKIKLMVPFLGTNLAAALTPLINVNGLSITNTNFVSGDFTQATGLQGNGTSKVLTLPYKASTIGTGNNGGMGWWETNIAHGTSYCPMGALGASNTQWFRLNCFDASVGGNQTFYTWGAPGNSTTGDNHYANGHFYGQRSSATLREMFINGSSVGSTNTTNDTGSGSADFNLQAFGYQGGATQTYWGGRCAVFYLTDGSLTSQEVSDLNSDLQTYLITPLGR